MSLLYKDLHAYLLGDDRIASLIGARLFGGKVPQWNEELTAAYGGPHPAIKYSETVEDHHTHLRGSSQSAVVIVSIDCLAKTYPDVKELADAVRRALDTYGGRMGDTFIAECLLVTEFDDYEDADDGSDDGVHTVNMEFRVWHDETAPHAQQIS